MSTWMSRAMYTKNMSGDMLKKSTKEVAMESRTWKKPTKKFFNKVGMVSERGYIPVEFNGKPGGWSDGHLCFFTFVPDNGTDGRERVDFKQSVTIDQYRRGRLSGEENNLRFDNPLSYLCKIDDEEIENGIAFFERMDGIKWTDWEYPVSIDDGYLNAIMYYAKKIHGKKAEVSFWSECEENYVYDFLRGKERTVPILVTVNDEPFALVMPVKCDMKFQDLGIVPKINHSVP